MALSFRLSFFALVMMGGLTGCASVPPGRAAVDDVTVRGARAVPASDTTDKLATKSSPKFLSLFRGVVFDYEILDRFVLQRDLARVERSYRAKGYYDARATAGQIIQTGDGHVRVEVVVDEGLPVRVDRVTVNGIEALPPAIQAAARRAAAERLRKGEPFEEEALTMADGDVRPSLSDRGYAYAQVTRQAAVDIVRHRAEIVFAVKPGPPSRFGEVTIEGLGDLPEAPVRRALDLKPGTPYSEAELDEAQQAILELGVFAAVDMQPQLPDPPPADAVVPIHIKVEPARLRTLRLGAGFEFDAMKTDVHLITGWESRNFLGGMRHLQISFKPGLVFYPLRVNNFVVPERFFPEEKFRIELRQPGFIEARTTGFIRPEFNVFPVLLNTEARTEDPVLGYAEFRGATGLERTYKKLFASLSQNVQIDSPFMYQGERDPPLSTIVISSPQLLAQLDLRDDRVHPRRGIFVGNDLQFAGLGGNVRDFRIQPEIRTYIPVAKKATFVTRASVGFLFPGNYGTAIRDGRSQFGADADRTRDYQIMFFRGFFSGGPNSNRGYPLRGVAPHAFVPFLNPATAAAQLESACAPGSIDPACSIPVGGFTLWEFQNEFRFVIDGPLAGAAFCDMSDVSPQTVDIRLKYLHLSCGVGARYDTPVGPIRLDVGYRIPGLQVLGGVPRSEYVPSDLFGIPIAIAFGIGEAF